VKPVLIGMNNPYNGDPRYALYPSPDISAGGRLCTMFLAAANRAGIHADSFDYISGFERMNLINTPTWDPVSAKIASRTLKPTLMGREVIICGVSVLTMMDLQRHEWLCWHRRPPDLFENSFDYVLIPHPSGRCREYNDPEVVVAVGDLLLEAWKKAQS
jgi:hypothetical protein